MVVNFSALADGQAISFNPAADVLHFDQSVIQAAALSVTVEGSNVRIEVVSGPHAGKDVVLLNVSPLQLATTNITFASGSALLFGDNSSGTLNDNAANTLTGTAQNDSINGFGGNDQINMSRGTGASNGADRVDGGAGFDTINYREYAVSAIAVNFATGSITGGGTGGAGSATFTNVERVIGTEFADSMLGSSAGQNLSGAGGNDTLEGAGGVDTLWGGAGADHFVYRETGSANADQIGDFAAGTDKIVLDGTVMSALGATGNFAASDGRFHAAAGATGGADANDRVIYNTTTGQLFYDPDGSGAQSAQLIATLLNKPALSATDIIVEGGSGGGGGGVLLTGTAGNDTLKGGVGDDTLRGLGGNDFLHGGDPLDDTDPQASDGNDVLEGGDGDDTLFGGTGNDLLVGGAGNDVLDARPQNRFLQPGIDTLDGGLGNDLYYIEHPGVTLIDAGGNDTVHAVDMSWTLGAGFENLVINNARSEFIGDGHGIGNELDNVLDGRPGWFVHLEGRGGNDLLLGSPKRDILIGGDGNDTLNGGPDFDTLTGGAGADTFVFADYPGTGDQITDFQPGLDRMHLDATNMPQLGASGTLSAGDGRFWAAAGATAGHDADDRLVYNTTNGFLFYDPDGSGAGEAALIAILDGAPALKASDITIVNGTTGGGGNPGLLIEGTSGNDTLTGTGGDDTILGHGGSDTLNMSRGTGPSNGADRVDGGAGFDTINYREYAVSGIAVNFASGTITGGGTGGAGSATFTNVERVIGTEFADSMLGSNAGENLSGAGGNDTLEGAGGVDTLWGGSGADLFIYRHTGTANADQIGDFLSGTDKIALDAAVMTALGTNGNFAAGDARFFAAAGATGGADASDRVIYNTTTRQIFYDPDGNGSQAGQLIATLQAGATLVATDIVVQGSGTPPPPPPGGGVVINGTAGHDSLVGGPGNDTINGFGGNDTLIGNAGDDLLEGGDGDDSLVGGDGNDTLDGGAGNNTLNGGLGDDTYIDAGVVFRTVSDAGGIDTAIITNFSSATLQPGIENLVMRVTDPNIHDVAANGNSSNNLIRAETTVASTTFRITGGAGNDTLIGSIGRDLFTFNANDGTDSVDGGPGNDDAIVFQTAAVFDMKNGTATGSGVSVSFTNVEIGVGSATGDRLVASDTGSVLIGRGGNDTLIGGAGNDVLHGEGFWDSFITEPGDDELFGGAGNDVLRGGNGSDTLSGGAGNDTLEGGGAGGTDGADHFVFDVAPGAANADVIVDFVSNSDKIVLDAQVMGALGANGQFAAGDGRFHAAPGATSGADANDRVVYNTTTGQLFYDPDGSGSQSAQLIATLQGAPALTATDIIVQNGTTGGGGNPGLLIEGTSGNDTLTGTGGDDTILGHAGYDQINMAFGGTASYGNDSIDGGTFFDTINFQQYAVTPITANFATGTITGGGAGGAGSATFVNIERIIGSNFADTLIGNASGQNLTGASGNDTLIGAGGNDTLWGGAGNDTFVYREAGTANADRIGDFASGADKLALDDVFFTTIGALGNFAAGDGRFHAAPGATGGADASDRVIYNTTTGQVFYDPDGSGAGAAQLIATLEGAPTLAATDITVI